MLYGQVWPVGGKVGLGAFKGGIYEGSFSAFWAFRQHQNSARASGWVDRSAHISARWQEESRYSNRFFETGPLIRNAQRFSAGFLEFFFAHVNNVNTLAKKPSTPIKIELSWADNQWADLDAHLSRPGGSFPSYSTNSWYDLNDVSFVNRNPNWGRPDLAIDNPVLNRDAPRAASGKETITLFYPGDDGDYTLRVHDAGNLWPNVTMATIAVWVGGSQKAVYQKALWSNQVWTPFTISNTGELTPVGTVEKTWWEKYGNS